MSSKMGIPPTGKEANSVRCRVYDMRDLSWAECIVIEVHVTSMN